MVEKLQQQCKTVTNVYSVIILINPLSLFLLCQDKCRPRPTLPDLPFTQAPLDPGSASDPTLILPPKAGYWRCNLNPPAHVSAVQTEQRGASELHYMLNRLC